MASKLGAYRYVECSARTGEGVTDVFHTAAKLALATVLESNNLRLLPALSGLFILG